MATADAKNPSYYQGTYTDTDSKEGPKTFDQILVSKRMLESNALIRYARGSTTIHPPHQGASDHSAIAATIEY
jgi:hypothetical protein